MSQEHLTILKGLDHPKALATWLTTLLQLAERTTDDVPAFQLAFVEDRYYEVTVGALSSRGYSIEEAVARVTVKLADLLRMRSRGDVATVRETAALVSTMAQALAEAESSRQLALPMDRAVQGD